MDLPVSLFLDKARMLLEGIGPGMLQNKITVRIEDAGFEDLVRKGIQAVEGIRRVGEDDVELLVAERQEVFPTRSFNAPF